MRKTIFLLAFLLMGIAVLGQTTFHKKFQGGILLGITPSVNGGLLGAGFQSQFFAPSQGLLVRFNEFGEPIWQKRYPTLNFIRNSIEVSDGYLIVGDSITTTGPLPRPRYSVVSKLTFSGGVSWSKIIGSTMELSSPLDVIRTPNGFLISGMHDEIELGYQRGVFLIHLDDNGNTLWSKNYYGTHPTFNGRISARLIQGDTLYACGHIQGNGCFVRVNLQTGELIGWSSFGGAFREEFFTMEATQDGNFVLAGLTRTTTGSEEERPWVVKVDRIGQRIWSKTYNIPGGNLGCRLVDAGDGGYILSMREDEGFSNYLTILAKIDGAGNLLWANNYGYSSGLGEIRKTYDGGFVALGAEILKVDKFGRVINGCCPAPVAFQVEEFLPPYQNPMMLSEDWEIAQPFSVDVVTDFAFNVSDFCTVPVTSIVEQIPVCQGDSIEINGAFYQAPNTIRDTVLNLEGGCDTVRVFNLVQIPQPIRVETIAFCPGDSVVLAGITYTQPDTVSQILPATTGCDTLLVTFLRYQTLPKKYQTTLFCPGDTVLVDGIYYFYPGVLPNPDTLLSTGVGCDTLLYQELSYPTDSSTVLVQCPSNLILTTAPSTALPVYYTMPSGTSDCTCPELSTTLVQGIPSGGMFPVGTTQVCYALSDICGAVGTCCFEVKIEEEQACDVKETPCIRYELLDISTDAEQNKTYRIRIANHCASPLLSASIQLPNGLDAVAPAQNSIYTSGNSREYSVRNPNFSPFHSVRFKALELGIADGQADVFEYTLPAQAAPVFIRVSTRLASGAVYEATLNTFECVLQAERSAMYQSGVPSSLRVFPNPSSGELFIEFPDWEPGLVQLQLQNIQGEQLGQASLATGAGTQSFVIPGEVPDGIYFLQCTHENGITQRVKFVLHK